MAGAPRGSGSGGPGSGGPGFDPTECAAVVKRALQMPGGADLVVGSLSGIPHAVVTPRRSGLFRADPARVQLGAWRYHATSSGRLVEAHVVGGIVLSEQTLSIAESGWRVARALRQHLTDYGPRILPDVAATLEGLAVACD